MTSFMYLVKYVITYFYDILKMNSQNVSFLTLNMKKYFEEISFLNKRYLR